MITGAAGCDGSLLVVRLLALGCEVVDAACFIGTYPRECKLHNLERAASAGDFRLVEGDCHDYHVVIHGTSWLPGCAKETTYRNCATNGGLLQAALRTDSSCGGYGLRLTAGPWQLSRGVSGRYR